MKKVQNPYVAKQSAGAKRQRQQHCQLSRYTVEHTYSPLRYNTLSNNSKSFAKYRKILYKLASEPSSSKNVQIENLQQEQKILQILQQIQ